MDKASYAKLEALLWVGIVTLIISRRVYRLVYSANLEKALRYTHLRWATIFAEKSRDLLDDILDYAGINTEPMDVFELFQSQALDPNVNRKRLMDIWRGKSITNAAILQLLIASVL